ncbi:MAG: aminotransferase class V-fold PLP-dependent enzyme [Halobacteriales archaeon]
MSGSNILDTEKIRRDFPILDVEVREGVPLVYLDSAATSHTPNIVCESIEEYYKKINSNIHRGTHKLSMDATDAYEEAHDKLVEFVGGSDREEMIFTKSTTESINLVAQSWGLRELAEGDVIILTEMEHHASLVTWQQIGKRTGATVKYIRIDDSGRLDMEHAKEIIDKDVRMMSLVHVSNVLGTVNPVKELSKIAHENGSLVLADGAQAAPSMPIDVKELDVDFYAFSGHKMAGPTGIGCLYGKEEILEGMEPFMYGGEMIRKVTFDSSSWNDLPWKFEAGTPPICQGIALAQAADYLEKIGLDKIWRHDNELAEYTIESLLEFKGAEVYGPPVGEERGGLVSFNLEVPHAHDIASILDDYGIATRAGEHCTHPLHRKLGISGTVRASYYLYNTMEEVDKLIAGIEEIKKIFE